MQPPKDLAKAGPGRALWAELTEAFDFDADPHRRAILAELVAVQGHAELSERVAELEARIHELADPN